MRQSKAVRGVSRGQPDFYSDKIEQYKASSEEALEHIKALDIEYSDRELEDYFLPTSQRLKVIVSYYENSIKVLEFNHQSEKGLAPDNTGIQDALDKALDQEDYMAHIDTQDHQLSRLNRIKDYCSRK